MRIKLIALAIAIAWPLGAVAADKEVGTGVGQQKEIETPSQPAGGTVPGKMNTPETRAAEKGKSAAKKPSEGTAGQQLREDAAQPSDAGSSKPPKKLTE
jgi:hypothetical protein